MVDVVYSSSPHVWVATTRRLCEFSKYFHEDKNEAEEGAHTHRDADGEGPRQLRYVVPKTRLLVREVLLVSGAVHRDADDVEDGCGRREHQSLAQ